MTVQYTLLVFLVSELSLVNCAIIINILTFSSLQFCCFQPEVDEDDSVLPSDMIVAADSDVAGVETTAEAAETADHTSL